MKKVFSSSADVIHRWANQIQDEARTSSNNVYFYDKKEIFSYGYHYVLAHFIDDNYHTVIINDDGYSKTTAKHISEVRQATSHKTQFFKSETDLKTVLKSIQANVKALVKARKPELYIDPSFNLWDRLNTFIEHTGRKEMKKQADYKEIQSLIEAIKNDPKNSIETLEANTKKRKRREAAQRRAQLKKERREFLNHKRNRLDLYDGKDYLRVSKNGEYIETSQGVSIDWDEAKRLLKLLDLKKLLGARVNDMYDVTAVNGSIKVGCHTIERAEVERIRPVIEAH